MSQKDEGSSAFIDLMTSLAVIFILLFVCVLNEKNLTKSTMPQLPSPQAAAEPTPKMVDDALDTAKKTREDILSQLRSAFQTENLQVEADPNDIWTLVVVIRQQELTFATNKADLNDKGRKTVEKVFSTIEPIVCKKYVNKVDWVIVEGHTDIEGNATITGQIDNIDLSSRRASSVVHHALRTLNRWKEDKVDNDLHCIRALLSPRGMGSSHPRSSSAKKELQQDRRVEVKVHVVAPPIEFFEAVNGLSKAKNAPANSP